MRTISPSGDNSGEAVVQMHPCFEPYFEVASTVTYGGIGVTLGKVRKDGLFPCKELLYVSISDAMTDADLEEYIKFHQSFVMNRVKHQWPHQFALVYDATTFSQGATSSVATLVERTMAFIMMHSSLGHHYKKFLYKVGALASHAATVQTLDRVIATFGPTTKPVVPHLLSDATASLAEKMRVDSSVAP